MKKFLLIVSVLLMAGVSADAQKGLTVKDITSGKYAAETMSVVDMLAGGETYAVLDADGKKVIEYSVKTGKQTGVLFDADQTLRGKVDKINGYEMSPDGTRMLVWNKVKRIYRRSFTADYYIYNIQTRVLEPLSDFGPQQSPVWSPDSRNVAFVRNNNIYLVRLLYDNAETQKRKIEFLYKSKEGCYNSAKNVRLKPSECV